MSTFQIILQVVNACLTLHAQTPQNGQTHSNNSSATADENCLSVFDHFVSLALKGLIEKFSYENYLKKAQQQTEEKKRKMEKCFQLGTCCSCKKQLVILKIHFF